MQRVVCSSLSRRNSSLFLLSPSEAASKPFCISFLYNFLRALQTSWTTFGDALALGFNEPLAIERNSAQESLPVITDVFSSWRWCWPQQNEGYTEIIEIQIILHTCTNKNTCIDKLMLKRGFLSSPMSSTTLMLKRIFLSSPISVFMLTC